MSITQSTAQSNESIAQSDESLTQSTTQSNESIAHRLTRRDEERLSGVHESLIKVVQLASLRSEIPFMVVEGLRTNERQLQLLNEKKTKTLKSKHLAQPDGFGHAVDLCGTEKKTSFEWATLRKINDAMQGAAHELGVPITWGGQWKSFPDGPHYELKAL